MKALGSSRQSKMKLISAAVLASLVCASAHAEVIFTDVTAAAGIEPDFYQGSTFHNLGVNWIDYNGDGWPDLFMVNGYNLKPHLYRNNGDGTFTKVDELLPDLPNVEMAGSVFADYDRDGDLDIYIQVTNEQFSLFNENEPDGPANILLKNMWVENGGQVIEGQPLFVNVAAAAGVDGVLPAPLGPDYPAQRSMTGGWLDYNRDGCMDLYVGQMVLQAGGNPANLPKFYKNNCDGTFEDVTVSSGVNSGVDPATMRPALAFFGGHLDDDMWPDMYAVHVHEPDPHHWDFLFKNNQDGTFTDLIPSLPGIGDDSGSGMGIDVADIDLDGNWDIYITDVFNTQNDASKGNTLYLGNGQGGWHDNSAPDAGVSAEFSWGANFFDVDHDGYEDLFVVNNRATKRLFLNNGDATFTDISDTAGIIANANEEAGRGSAVADYDGDGDLDIAFINNAGRLQLYRNDSTNLGQWLKFDLAGVQSSPDAIGTLVKVTAAGKTMMRQVKGGSSAHSQDDLVMHFGMGTATRADRVEVSWPSGQVSTLTQVPVNMQVNLVEGQTSAPSVTGVSHRNVARGTTLTMTISGQGFLPGVRASMNAASGIILRTVTYVDAQTVTITMTSRADASTGLKRITLTNYDDGAASAFFLVN